jgi:hypothetical protein
VIDVATNNSANPSIDSGILLQNAKRESFILPSKSVNFLNQKGKLIAGNMNRAPIWLKKAIHDHY